MQDSDLWCGVHSTLVSCSNTNEQKQMQLEPRETLIQGSPQHSCSPGGAWQGAGQCFLQVTSSMVMLIWPWYSRSCSVQIFGSLFHVLVLESWMQSNCACAGVSLTVTSPSIYIPIYHVLIISTLSWSLSFLSPLIPLFLIVSLIYFQVIRSKSKTTNERAIGSWGLCHQWIDVVHRECAFLRFSP